MDYRLGALLAVLLSGCAVCRTVAVAPRLPPDVEYAEMLDTTEQCWVLRVPEPVLRIGAEVAMTAMRLSMQEKGGGLRP